MEHSPPWLARRTNDGVRGWVLAGAEYWSSWACSPGPGAEIQEGGRDPFGVVAALVTMFLLGVAAGVWHAQRAHRRTWRTLQSAITAADRLLGDHSGARLPPARASEFAPLVDLINRFATMRDASAAVLDDRDAQIAALERLGRGSVHRDGYSGVIHPHRITRWQQ